MVTIIFLSRKSTRYELIFQTKYEIFLFHLGYTTQSACVQASSSRYQYKWARKYPMFFFVNKKESIYLWSSSWYDHCSRRMSCSSSSTRSIMSSSTMVTIELSWSRFRCWAFIIQLDYTKFSIQSSQTMCRSNSL